MHQLLARDVEVYDTALAFVVLGLLLAAFGIDRGY